MQLDQTDLVRKNRKDLVDIVHGWLDSTVLFDQRERMLYYGNMAAHAMKMHAIRHWKDSTEVVPEEAITAWECAYKSNLDSGRIIYSPDIDNVSVTKLRHFMVWQTAQGRGESKTTSNARRTTIVVGGAVSAASVMSGSNLNVGSERDMGQLLAKPETQKSAPRSECSRYCS